MDSYLTLAAFALLAATANAACGNSCSGHGRCTNYQMTSKAASTTTMSIELNTVTGTYNALGYDTGIEKKDSCTCYTRMGMHGKTVFAYDGADCSQRTCPHAKAHGDNPVATGHHDNYAECSNRGTCDRKTGQCICEAGFEGAACERTCCGGDCGATQCSGQGRCMFLQDIVEDTKDIGVAWTDASPTYYQQSKYNTLVYTAPWDAQKSMGCWCDAGFRGANCEVQECPSAADPMGGPGAESGRTCSGRGTCSEGQCSCFKGYFGSACEFATHLWE